MANSLGSSPLVGKLLGLSSARTGAAAAAPRPRLAFALSSAQRWTHSCCSKASLSAALADEGVTAIETDLLWSASMSAVVHAHPPATESDLPFDVFLDRVTASDAPPKHVKLDFKVPAIVAPCVASIDKYYAAALAERATALWLNADVLPGPGAKDSAPFDADAFVRSCARIRGATLSLGWVVDVGLGDAYGDLHVDAMVALLAKHAKRLKANDCRVVVAANLRMALRSLAPLARLLATAPVDGGVEVLLWTGTGEPPVSQSAVAAARKGLAAFGDRVAFDAATTSGAAAASASAKLTLWRAWRKTADALRPKARPAPPQHHDDDDDDDDDDHSGHRRRRKRKHAKRRAREKTTCCAW